MFIVLACLLLLPKIEIRDTMAQPTNLVIVESPAKAKTIEKFLGKDYRVVSSFGHIRDLDSKKISIDFDNRYKPLYSIPAEKEKVISALKKESKTASLVWLATDEDREGEAIAWHLYEALGLTPERTRRIVFHEITKNAILHAVENPREIDANLVNAQQARRVLDRIVGYEVSPILWRKVKPSLSAGRVQSVAVRLIVEREREIEAFQPTSFYRVSGIFEATDTKGKPAVLKAGLSDKIHTLEEAKKFLEDCSRTEFSIASVEKKPIQRNPSPPFTTSSLQQEAGRRLGFSVSRTMSVAQRLYEAGHITYMRTDSVNLSNLAINTAAKYIDTTFGKEYLKTRNFSTKSKGAQEAHEAIRPTYIDREALPDDVPQEQKRLYDLIRRRTLASQMAAAKLEKTTIKIVGAQLPHHFLAVGEIVVFDGFLKLYSPTQDDDMAQDGEKSSGLLPPMDKGATVTYRSIMATERYTSPPPRYNEPMLVRKLEELGIGRPSTYAPTISTVQNRGYVEKENREPKQRPYQELLLVGSKIEQEKKSENYGAEKTKLFPTDIGVVVTDFLSEHFQLFMDYHFTAKVEQEFDDIATGQVVWDEMIDAFYKPFHKIVEKTSDAKAAKGERELGKDPATGRPIFARIGRYGPMLQIGLADDEEKPRFASLPKGKSIQNIELDEALTYFELPREVGVFEGEIIVADNGRYGPYVRHNKKFVSLPQGVSPNEVTLDEAIRLIKGKREMEAKALLKTFPEEPDLQIKEGRYGPYIAYQKKNYKIPKNQEPKELTLEQCRELISMQPQKEKRKKQ